MVCAQLSVKQRYGGLDLITAHQRNFLEWENVHFGWCVDLWEKFSLHK